MGALTSQEGGVMVLKACHLGVYTLSVVVGLMGTYAYILVYVSRVSVRGGGWPKGRSGYSVDLP